jgi:hypothetical protein
MGGGFGRPRYERGRRPGATSSLTDTLVCLGGQGAPPNRNGPDYRFATKLRRRMRRLARDPKSVRTATRNFDLELAIASDCIPQLYVESGMIPVVYGGNRAELFV